jgi:hypothetical protein
MSDPGTNPLHDLVTDPQDQERPQPRIRLGTFLALLRVAAGRRGAAAVAWNRDGFSYTVIVEREGGAPGVALDVDPTALGGGEARQRILDALA